MKLNLSKEWYEKHTDHEGDITIGPSFKLIKFLKSIHKVPKDIDVDEYLKTLKEFGEDHVMTQEESKALKESTSNTKGTSGELQIDTSIPPVNK